MLSYVAGATNRCRLGMSVLVLPFRNPVLNAKMVTTLDVLSGGRVIFGIGVGWMPEEFEAMGASYEHRGTLTDEHIEMFKALCADGKAEYHGEHFDYSGMTFFPKPVQRPHPPVWVGGNTRAALRRTARLGDAWHGIRLTPAELTHKRRQLRDLCEQAGRPPQGVQTTLRLTLSLDQPLTSDSGDRVPLTGTVPQIRDDIARYEEATLDYIVLSVAADTTAATVDAIRRFADEVMGKS